METNTRELGIIHYILSASDNALDATRNLIRYHHLVNTTTSLVIEESDRQVAIDTTFRPGLEGFERQIAEWGTTTFLAELRRLTDSNIVPQRLTFVHRRESEGREFRDFFGCPFGLAPTDKVRSSQRKIFYARYVLSADICSTSWRRFVKRRLADAKRPSRQPAPG